MQKREKEGDIARARQKREIKGGREERYGSDQHTCVRVCGVRAWCMCTSMRECERA